MVSLLAEVLKEEPLHAAGVLSRAALALESDGLNPDSIPLSSNEVKLRERLVKLAFDDLRSLNADQSEASLRQRVIDLFDDELAKAAAPIDEIAAANRLGADAALPSDTYILEFEEMPGFPEFNDKPLARETVSHPHYLQEFGPRPSDEGPSLISLFGRWYNKGRDSDRFIFLVAGARLGKTLRVFNYLRVFPSEVSLAGAAALTEILEKFAIWNDVKFQLGEKDTIHFSGRFIYHLRYRSVTSNLFIELISTGASRPGDLCQVSAISKYDAGVTDVAFAFGINYSKYYRSVLKRLNRSSS